nr:MAG TPA: hypothetical protein [Bacteriophage sp.]DAS82810.1 MAG TPA: hypothetical protein [Caudoviricetes sp.]DAY52643.1 MAG TPA: hypothetical protein [Caudoviricetes sp.]DAZ73131.1 MAG TPA: hypothetical protein [Caudoviricetes sp.]
MSSFSLNLYQIKKGEVYVLSKCCCLLRRK